MPVIAQSGQTRAVVVKSGDVAAIVAAKTRAAETKDRKHVEVIERETVKVDVASPGIQGSPGSGAIHSTSDLPEGTNLYYTDARADARVELGIDAHEAEADPHPQYVSEDESEAIAIAAAGASMLLHLADPDPHPQYVDEDDVIDGGNF